MQQAVSYLRVSGKGQVDGDGFPRQREVIAAYAKQARAQLVEEYRDEGVTGTDAAEARPALAELLAHVERYSIKLVLIERQDRLARDLIIGELIIQKFIKLGVRVIACDTGMELTTADNGNPVNKFVRQIMGAVAELDKALTVAKLRVARERLRKANGRCEGPMPFGSTEIERGTLDQIIKWRDQRLTMRQICDKLNAAKIATRKGGIWKPGTVAQILKREEQAA